MSLGDCNGCRRLRSLNRDGYCKRCEPLRVDRMTTYRGYEARTIPFTDHVDALESIKALQEALAKTEEQLLALLEATQTPEGCVFCGTPNRFAHAALCPARGRTA